MILYKGVVYRKDFDKGNTGKDELLVILSPDCLWSEVVKAIQKSRAIEIPPERWMILCADGAKIPMLSMAMEDSMKMVSEVNHKGEISKTKGVRYVEVLKGKTKSYFKGDSAIIFSSRDVKATEVLKVMLSLQTEGVHYTHMDKRLKVVNR